MLIFLILSIPIGLCPSDSLVKCLGNINDLYLGNSIITTLVVILSDLSLDFLIVPAIINSASLLIDVKWGRRADLYPRTSRVDTLALVLIGSVSTTSDSLVKSQLLEELAITSTGWRNITLLLGLRVVVVVCELIK